MNELVKAVIALALATAAAVWLLGLALHLWPDTGQLAYGNPLPYLKVRMDSGAVKFWVEDFGGLPYERVWLYVNGRLASSGGPGTDAAAKCGDEVAAVVKYHSGVKKLEGRILCTKPIKPPNDSVQATQLITTNKAIETALDAYEPAANQTGVPIALSGECQYLGYPTYNFIGKVYLRVIRSDVFLVPANEKVWRQDYTLQLSGGQTKSLSFRLGKIGTSPFTSFAALTKEYYTAWARGVYEERVLYRIYPDGAVIEKKYYVYAGGTGIPERLLAYCYVLEEKMIEEVYKTDKKEAPSNATVNYKAVLTIKYANGTEKVIGGLAGIVQIWAYGDEVGAKISKVALPGENINLKDPWESIRITFYDVQTNEKTGEFVINQVMTITQLTNLYQFIFGSEKIGKTFDAYIKNRCSQGGFLDIGCMFDFYLNDLLGIPDRPIQQLLYGKIPYITYTYSMLVTSSYVSKATSVGYSTVGFLGVPDPTSLGLYFYTSPTLPIKIPTAKTPTPLSLSNDQTGETPSGTSTRTTSTQCIIDGEPRLCIYSMGDLLVITKT
jgi:hypothetical protein